MHKIIHIIPEFNVGGAENSIIELSNELIQENTVGIWIFKDRINQTIVAKFEAPIKIKTFSKRCSFLFVINLIRSTWKEDPDVIHAHLTPSLYPLLLLSVLHRKSKKFFTVHYEKFKIHNPLLRIFYQFILPISGIKFITLSNSSKTELEFFLKIKKNFYLLPNGIKEKGKSLLFNEAENELNNLKTGNAKVFISVGRIVEIKNFTLLLEVFSKLYAEKRNVILIILGAPPSGQEDILENLKTQKPKNVHFLGNKSNVNDYLLLSDCYCSSSFSEGLPMSLIEALSCKLPIISTNYKNVNMVLTNGENGFVVSSFNVDDYHKAILKILGLSKNKYDEFSVNSYKLFKTNYQISEVAKSYSKLLKT